jgi:hypothetical protein
MFYPVIVGFVGRALWSQQGWSGSVKVSERGHPAHQRGKSTTRARPVTSLLVRAPLTPVARRSAGESASETSQEARDRKQRRAHERIGRASRGIIVHLPRSLTHQPWSRSWRRA